MGIGAPERIIVTGGCGFLGANVCPMLAWDDHHVQVIDDLRGQHPPAARAAILAELEAAPGIEVMTIALGEALLQPLKTADIVVHLAGLPGVRNQDRVAHWRGNVACCLEAAELASRADARRLVFTSSSSVYAPTPDTVAEGTELGPLSPYGRSKLEAERALALACERYGIELAILRLSTMFGPWQRSDMLFARLIESSLGGPRVIINGDGSSSRAYLYVADVARAIATAATFAMPEQQVILNLGGAEATTTAAAIDLVEDVTGLRPTVELGPKNPVEHQRIMLDSSRAHRVLSWYPTTSVPTGLKLQISKGLRGADAMATSAVPACLGWA